MIRQITKTKKKHATQKGRKTTGKNQEREKGMMKYNQKQRHKKNTQKQQ